MHGADKLNRGVFVQLHRDGQILFSTLDSSCIGVLIRDAARRLRHGAQNFEARPPSPRIRKSYR